MKTWMIGAPFALLGLVVLGVAMFLFSLDGATKSWPTTDGVITSSRLDTNTVWTKDVVGNRVQRQASAPEAHYTYTVDGVGYEGSRITREPHGGDSSSLVVARYPAGKAVKVHYDPKDPASSVLEVGTSVGGVVVAAIGGFFLLFGIAMAVVPRFLVKRPA